MLSASLFIIVVEVSGGPERCAHLPLPQTGLSGPLEPQGMKSHLTMIWFFFQISFFSLSLCFVFFNVWYERFYRGTSSFENND